MIHTLAECRLSLDWLVLAALCALWTVPLAFGFRGQIYTLEMEPFYWTLDVKISSHTGHRLKSYTLTSSLSQPIISPNETCWQRQYVGSSGSSGCELRSGIGTAGTGVGGESSVEGLILALLVLYQHDIVNHTMIANSTHFFLIVFIFFLA